MFQASIDKSDNVDGSSLLEFRDLKLPYLANVAASALISKLMSKSFIIESCDDNENLKHFFTLSNWSCLLVFISESCVSLFISFGFDAST